MINSDIVEGKWKKLKGRAKQQWGKLTDDELNRVNGSAEELSGLVQERYGLSREEAKKQVDQWMKRQ
ncbi:MAG: CsbD family protein [Gammaproteobacteria bacterium]|jgi:uncharacterized protein YjbJ (UPF0337 family)